MLSVTYCKRSFLFSYKL